MRNNIFMHIYEWKNKNFQKSLLNLFIFLNRIPNISFTLFEFFFWEKGKGISNFSITGNKKSFFSADISPKNRLSAGTEKKKQRKN